jgi:hypothetical protein
MSEKKSWLDALKDAIEVEPQIPREDLQEPKATTVQNVRNPRKEAGDEVVDPDAARAARTEDERRLIAAGWSPKERCGPLGLTIWANPETGFYCSREVALLRLERKGAS